MPPEVWQLYSHVTWLSLSCNQLERLPQELCRLLNLRELRA